LAQSFDRRTEDSYFLKLSKLSLEVALEGINLFPCHKKEKKKNTPRTRQKK
jgi:hypothetical protein